MERFLPKITTNISKSKILSLVLKSPAYFKYARNREFAIKNAFSECANISLERIRKTIEILSETDLNLKTKSSGGSGDMLTLEQCVAKAMALR